MPPESFILQPTDWLNPLDMDEAFGRPGRLEVDLGCGKGRFLLARASAFPEVRFLGIDRQVGRLLKIDRRLQQRGIANVRLIRLEAAYSVKYLLPPGGVSTVYIFFPDPWPKRRHHNRRLFQVEFLDTLADTLAEDGRVHMATDHLDYYAESRARFLRHPSFTEVETFVPSDDEQTDFERIFLAKGDPIGRCSFAKVREPAPK